MFGATSQQRRWTDQDAPAMKWVRLVWTFAICLVAGIALYMIGGFIASWQHNAQLQVQAQREASNADALRAICIMHAQRDAKMSHILDGTSAIYAQYSNQLPPGFAHAMAGELRRQWSQIAKYDQDVCRKVIIQNP